MKNGWYVRVEGSAHGLAVARREFAEDPDIEFVEDNGAWTLWSVALNQIPYGENVAEKVIKATQEELNMINGALALQIGGDFPQEHLLHAASSLYFLEDGGKRHMIVLVEALKINVTMGAVKVGDPPVRQDSLAQIWRRLSQKDKYAKEVLYFLGRERDWVNLNKLKELVDDNQDHCKWAEDEGVLPTGFFARFSMSANNYHVSGRTGRHGKLHERTPKTQAPLTLQEAERYILAMVQAWLDKRV